MKKNSFFGSIGHIKNFISQKRKWQLVLLIFVAFCAGLLEILSVASVIPFIKSITNQNFLDYVNNFFFNWIVIRDQKELIIFFGIIFCLLALLNSISRSLLIYINSRYSNIVISELSVALFKAKLTEKYLNHTSSNSSTILSAVATKMTSLHFSLNSFIMFFSFSFIFLCLLITMILINPKIILICVLFFGVLYFLLVIFGKKILHRNSRIVNEEQTKIVKNLQNGVGLIREIILNKNLNYYLKNFEESNIRKAKRQATNEFMQFSPRYIFEGLGISLIVFIIIYNFTFEKKFTNFLDIFPTLAALAIGAQRILPLLNSLYVYYSQIKSNIFQLVSISEILQKLYDRESQENQIIKRNINFKKKIIFENITFAYPNHEPVFESANLQILKGQRVGIVGKTGSGKSTFLDLFMGLIDPESGFVLIDGGKLTEINKDSWQSKISHVPQKIFLTDGSFLENIALGKDKSEIKLNKIIKVAKQSQIHDFINGLKSGYNQTVGERGSLLSGGQIQRIGLARALYKKSQIIIFDEATNSLDYQTEGLVMKEIKKIDKNLTIIIVAHRLNTLNHCDAIYEIRDKKFKKIK